MAMAVGSQGLIHLEKIIEARLWKIYIIRLLHTIL